MYIIYTISYLYNINTIEYLINILDCLEVSTLYNGL